MGHVPYKVGKLKGPPESGLRRPGELAVLHLTNDRTRFVAEILRDLIHVMIRFCMIGRLLEELLLRIATGDEVAVRARISTAQSLCHRKHLLFMASRLRIILDQRLRSSFAFHSLP